MRGSKVLTWAAKLWPFVKHPCQVLLLNVRHFKLMWAKMQQMAEITQGLRWVAEFKQICINLQNTRIRRALHCVLWFLKAVWFEIGCPHTLDISKYCGHGSRMNQCREAEVQPLACLCFYLKQVLLTLSPSLRVSLNVAQANSRTIPIKLEACSKLTEHDTLLICEKVWLVSILEMHDKLKHNQCNENSCPDHVDPMFIWSRHGWNTHIA